MSVKTSDFSKTLGLPSFEDCLSRTSDEILKRVYRETAEKGDFPRFLESLIELDRVKQERALTEATVTANRGMMWASWVLVFCTIIQILIAVWPSQPKVEATSGTSYKINSDRPM